MLIDLAFGIGTVPMPGVGAVVGLAAYGIVKLLDESGSSENISKLKAVLTTASSVLMNAQAVVNTTSSVVMNAQAVVNTASSVVMNAQAVVNTASFVVNTTFKVWVISLKSC